jgi:hypothetical protein
MSGLLGGEPVRECGCLPLPGRDVISMPAVARRHLGLRSNAAGPNSYWLRRTQGPKTCRCCDPRCSPGSAQPEGDPMASRAVNMTEVACRALQLTSMSTFSKTCLAPEISRVWISIGLAGDVEL